MDTPICDFVTAYALSGTSRFHMPGAKGVPCHGLESIDITEIKGAGYLYSEEGIIAQSEKNASLLFGSGRTLYSTEGSSLSIKAMLLNAVTSLGSGERALILAPRNVHKAFIDAAALIDFDAAWIMPQKPLGTICQAYITPEDVSKALLSLDRKPTAVYITSPDYLGLMLDVKGIKKVCSQHGIPLLVDNAHGAYLRFLEKSLHPLDMGADMCCDSAHKTLPVYTGGGYLHINAAADKRLFDNPKGKMSVFASTSPSYIIMQSLDNCNRILSEEFPARLETAVRQVIKVKNGIRDMGYDLIGNEPMKISILTSSFGISGDALAQHLRENGVECEYSDEFSLVLMPSVYNTQEDYDKLLFALSLVSPGKADIKEPLALPCPETRMSIRQGMFSDAENVPADLALGRVCACGAVSCQPSIPIAISGEVITDKTIRILKEYGIKEISVVK